MNIKDVVTLNDKNKYQVVSKTVYEETTYYYLVDINNISNVKFLYENIDKLTEVEDQQLVKLLLPKFFEEIKEYML